MSSIRSFIAINLPEKTKAEIGAFQEKLRRQPHPIRWENPENFHINLHFLGEMKEAPIGRISSSLEQTVNKDSFNLMPGHLEYLYKRHGDSIIYLSVEGDLKKLKELREQVCRAVELATRFDTPTRFLPHITIGRLKPHISQLDKKRILSDIINFQPRKFKPFMVQEIKIMQTNFLADTTHGYTVFSTVGLDHHE